jgi:hypothetical protein
MEASAHHERRSSGPCLLDPVKPVLFSHSILLWGVSRGQNRQALSIIASNLHPVEKLLCDARFRSFRVVHVHLDPSDFAGSRHLLSNAQRRPAMFFADERDRMRFGERGNKIFQTTVGILEIVICADYYQVHDAHSSC